MLQMLSSIIGMLGEARKANDAAFQAKQQMNAVPMQPWQTSAGIGGIGQRGVGYGQQQPQLIDLAGMQKPQQGADMGAILSLIGMFMNAKKKPNDPNANNDELSNLFGTTNFGGRTSQFPSNFGNQGYTNFGGSSYQLPMNFQSSNMGSLSSKYGIY